MFLQICVRKIIAIDKKFEALGDACWGLNPGPSDQESDALSTAPQARKYVIKWFNLILKTIKILKIYCLRFIDLLNRDLPHFAITQ